MQYAVCHAIWESSASAFRRPFRSMKSMYPGLRPFAAAIASWARPYAKPIASPLLAVLAAVVKGNRSVAISPGSRIGGEVHTPQTEASGN